MNATYGNLPFDEAALYLKSKVAMPARRWEDFTGEMHARAFVVAGAMRSDLLTDLYQEILKGIEGKSTLADFRNNFDTIVARRGWDYKGTRAWRTATIYNTNLSTAYAAGREIQRQDPDIRGAFPYDRYRTMDDGRVRVEHKSWNNVLLPVDHPWWTAHTPPNGWGCRCWKEPVARSEHEEFAKSKTFQTTAPDNGTYDWKNPATGVVEKVPNGIDPGWNYNVGKAAWGSTISKQAQADWEASANKWIQITPDTATRVKTVPLDTPLVPSSKLPRGAAAAAKRIASILGGPERVFTFEKAALRCDALVNSTALGKMIDKSNAPYIDWIADTISDPFEIWLVLERHTATGRIALRQRFIKGFTDKTGERYAVVQTNGSVLESWIISSTAPDFARSGKRLYRRGV